jgi:hypothetical protein
MGKCRQNSNSEFANFARSISFCSLFFLEKRYSSYSQLFKMMKRISA